MKYEDIELKVNIFDGFTFLVQDALENLQYPHISRTIEDYAKKLAGIEISPNHDGIKLQMILDLYGDWQENRTYENYKDYKWILLEILCLEIK